MKAILITAFFLVGCSLLGDFDKPVALENRTLLVSKTIPGLEHPYRSCTKSFLGNCRKWELKTDYYNLTDQAVRDKLSAMGFVCRVKDRVIP